jgi:hypothetical protein
MGSYGAVLIDSSTYCSYREPGTVEFYVSRARRPDQAIQALTQKAIAMFARAALDGTRFRIHEFSVGCGGFYPECPQRVRPINPLSPFLESEVYRAEIAYMSYDDTKAVYYCRVPRDEAVAGLGEIGLWAEIIQSPLPFEIGTWFLHTVQHFPVITKVHSMVETFRIELQFA